MRHRFRHPHEDGLFQESYRHGRFHSPHRYVHWRLQKRIFAWFGVTIVLTTMVVALVGELSFPGLFGGSKVGTPAGGVNFLAHELARSWDDRAALSRFARDAADDLGLGLQISGAEHQPVAQYGPVCSDRPLARAPIDRDDGTRLGELTVCAGPWARGHSLHWLLPLGAALFVLWGASGALSRRLVRPLRQVVRVAQDIGEGRLSSRVAIDHWHVHDELQLLGRVINEMAERIERQLADQRALLATVSHEIRSPLSRIRLLVEFARQKASAAGGREGGETGSGENGGGAIEELDHVEREIAEIDALVSDLLANARLDFAAFRFTELDAVAVARAAAERTSLDPGRIEASAEQIPFEGDATLVLRAVANLVENATKHGGGVERLCVRATADRVTFLVEDHGSGLPAGQEARIFEPFAKEHAGGGLGLALVRRIAEAHDGRAFAENRPEGGARVGIELSRIQARAGAAPSPRRSAAPAAPREVRSS